MDSTKVVLPKYIQNANRTLEVIAQQPNKTWTDTQRALGIELNLPQPVLSDLVQLLETHGKIRRSTPLPVRGRNFALEVIDDTPFDRPVRRQAKAGFRPEDRAMTSEEQLTGAINIGADATVERLGQAIVYTIRSYVDKEERWSKTRSDLTENVRRYKDAFEDEKQQRRRAETENERMQQSLQLLEVEKNEVRGQLNQLLLQGKKIANTVPATELMDEESRRVLEMLMKAPSGSSSEQEAS